MLRTRSPGWRRSPAVGGAVCNLARSSGIWGDHEGEAAMPSVRRASLGAATEGLAGTADRLFCSVVDLPCEAFSCCGTPRATVATDVGGPCARATSIPRCCRTPVVAFTR